MKHLFAEVFFSFIGYGIIKCLTLGRYPRTMDLRRQDAPDFLLLSVIGLAGSVAAVVLIAWLFS